MQLQESTTQLKKNLSSKVIQSNGLKQTRQTVRDQLKLKEKELADNEEKIDTLCEGEEYLEKVVKLKEKIDKMQMECGVLRSSELIYKKYVSEMKSAPCCPVCHKNMQSAEVHVLTKEIQEKIQSMPRDLKNAEKRLKDESLVYEKLIELKLAFEGLKGMKSSISNSKVDFGTFNF